MYLAFKKRFMRELLLKIEFTAAHIILCREAYVYEAKRLE